ncbi:MAG: HDIG domain-containing protein [Myxococcales bacterium]|nr:HDIG domain-containing protein [Myxococcales bacterium]
MPIRRRPTAGAWAGLTLSVLFAAVMVPLSTCDLWGGPAVGPEGRVGRFSLRLPEMGVYRDLVSPPTIEHRRIVLAAGSAIDRRDRPLIEAFDAGRRPPAIGLLLGLAISYFLVGLLFTTYLRNFGHQGKLLRTQVALLVAVVASAVVGKAFLMFTPLPAFLIPLGALSLAVATHHDRQIAFSTTVVAALVIGSLVPFDLVVSLVLLMQGFGAVLAMRQSLRLRASLVAGLGAGVVAALAYVAIYFLIQGRLSSDDLTTPGESGLLAALGGGLAAGLLATVVAPLLERALGQLHKGRLIELGDLNRPLLRQIADKAPGTWAHSLAMANMAEVAATAIGANALLTRIGAYYHDLGKSVQPEYYIENLRPGERSPHEGLDPEISADAIFAHCTEGVKLGRKEGVPEPILDFMHMHHGNGLLEYFWHKCQELGNPKKLTEQDFRYKGIPPQTRETAILAICDAVEAASRTLREPDERSITNLVQRIVFGKLRLGQLDESGLSSTDLKCLSNSLIDTLKSSFHVRIEYPWQREERREGAVQIAAVPPAVTVSQTILIEPRLDSADAPRPAGEGRVATPAEGTRNSRAGQG